MKKEDLIWRDRKRNFMGLPWTFTVYGLDTERFYLQCGFFTTREDEVRLYRITDVSLRKTLWQKLTGTGTIHVESADKALGDFDIVNVRRPDEVKELLSQSVEEARRANRVYMRESMDGMDGDGDGIPDGLDPDVVEHDHE